MRLSESLKVRGLLYDVSDEKLYEKLDQGSMTFYLGADPTGDSLHIGHLATYMVAKRLADAGHQAILLIGGGTGLIGDPSGKSKERNLLTLEESLKNANALVQQVKTLIPSAQVVNNHDWLKEITMIGFLRDIGKHFNLNQMLAKETVKSRLESGISFTEFSYQIIQSLDFLHLYDHHQCQLQIGGQDQWGNITAGLDLIRKKHPEGAEAYGLTFPLITKSDGEKFGKTAGGSIWLDAEKTSPYAFYQYWLNLSDVDSIKMLYHFSFKPLSEIKALEALMQDSPHLRHAQKTLAEEMTELVHQKSGLNTAQAITEAFFSGQFNALAEPLLKMAFTGLKSAKVAPKTPLIEALIKTELVPSKSQGRTLLAQQAVRVNDHIVTDENQPLTEASALQGRYHILRKGKKEYALIELS
jgi:tyrosyl-tRNA synthetase